MSGSSYVREAAAAWRLLNGIVCIYKPVSSGFRRDLQSKICEDLNSMKLRKPKMIVETRRIEGAGENSEIVTKAPRDRDIISISKEGPDTIQVLKGPSYADHPLVVGPRYIPQDVKIFDVSSLGRDTSGLSVLGINRGVGNAMKLPHMRWMRAYVVSGRFGTATDNCFHTGRIVDKSTFHRIHRNMLERLLESAQASHQRAMFETTGLGLGTELSYELASQGMVRPAGKTGPIIYALTCTKFDLPDFEIEVHVINETEEYLKGLINDFGLRLHSTATCTKLRCIKYGPFTVDHALLKKHWGVESLINNSLLTKKILKSLNMNRRDPLITADSIDLKPTTVAESASLS